MNADALLEALSRDVRAGLTASPKWLSYRYFYDAEGSKLFEEICKLEEYYLTRTERSILLERAPEIAALFPQGAWVVELGSGSAEKTRILLAAMLKVGRVRYVPIDISVPALEESVASLRSAFDALEIAPIAGDYEESLAQLGRVTERPKLVLWLGSSIGNLDREQAAAFLGRVRRGLSDRDRLLIGFDLRKDTATLERAYDDAKGVTAEFNLNLLKRINAELRGQFDLASFRHVARYDEPKGRIEMYLESTRDQVVTIGALGLSVAFARGERVHTENSYKYDAREIAEVARGAGLESVAHYTDAKGWFALELLRPAAE